MAAPTSYTEDTLGFYIHDYLGSDEMAACMGWDLNHIKYSEAVDDTLLVYEVSDITTITGAANIRKLRAIAKASIWHLIVVATAGDYDLTIEGAKYTRSQIHDHAKAMYQQEKAMAESLGADFGDSSKVTMTGVTYANDLYTASATSTANEWNRVQS